MKAGVAEFTRMRKLKPDSDVGRYRSGQPGQTVNLLALRLRMFESCPAHTVPTHVGIFVFKEWYMNFFYVYILFSEKDRKLYIGFTADLKKRVEQHAAGLNTSTKFRRPLQLIYAESFIQEQDARRREKFYKSGRGREVLHKQLEFTFLSL